MRHDRTMTDKKPTGMRNLSRQECLDLLETVPVGRIAATVEFRPFIFPVNFRLFEDQILIRTVSGTKLAAAMSGQIVAFEADGFEFDGSSGWSVLVRGPAREVTDPDELARALKVPVHTFAFDEVPDRLVLISTAGMTGRGFDHTTG